jgi:hypothetical protein
VVYMAKVHLYSKGFDRLRKAQGLRRAGVSSTMCVRDMQILLQVGDGFRYIMRRQGRVCRKRIKHLLRTLSMQSLCGE